MNCQMLWTECRTVFAKRRTPAPSAVSNTVLMLSSFNWQPHGRERRVSVVCCVLNPPNIRQFSAWAVADLPAVINQQLEYTVWDFQCLAAGAAAYSEIRRQLFQPRGKGWWGWCSQTSTRACRCLVFTCALWTWAAVHPSPLVRHCSWWGWNRALIRLWKYHAWYFGFKRFCFHGLMYSQSFTKWSAWVNPKHLFREITLCLFQSLYNRTIWCE